MPAALCQVIPLSILGDKAGKSEDLGGACSPIVLHVTVRLGGSMAVALNAIASVHATDGGGRFCARGLLTLLNATTGYRRRRQKCPGRVTLFTIG